MAERLRSRGFRTGGFVGAYVLDHKWGIAQGFEKYFDNFDLSKYRSVSLSSVERRGDEVADHAHDRRLDTVLLEDRPERLAATQELHLAATQRKLPSRNLDRPFPWLCLRR